MTDFSGKVALVTGASSGIGRSTALAYAREGAHAVVSDVMEDSGHETVRLIEQAGGEAVFVKADVSNPMDCESLVKETIDQYGRIDYACNNAGIGGEANLTADYTVESWQQVIAVNLSGVFYCMKYEIPAMLESGGGSIVNMASILGQVGFANSPAYVAAKHGVLGLTKTAAIEYATHNIRINAVCPAFIYTLLLENAGMAEGTDMYDYVASLHPMKRLGKPEEVADLVLWLCSEGASFVTGSAYLVDGGYVAQ
jgi:NAD(P)-dependent dehydrogenase (short-subunit alcohol dehydrogenase family)